MEMIDLMMFLLDKRYDVNKRDRLGAPWFCKHDAADFHVIGPRNHAVGHRQASPSAHPLHPGYDVTPNHA
jgi:hypothetical protein